MALPEPPRVPSFPELPGAPGLPRPPWEQEPTLLPKTPGIAGGIVTASSKGWQLVEYADISNGQKIRFSSKPIVVALAEVRFGDVLPVTAPKITVPSIKLPTLSSMPSIVLPTPSSIPRVARDDFNSGDYCQLVAEKARDKVHDLDLGWLLNPAKAIIADTLIYWSFYAAMYGIGFILNVLWDSFVQPQIDKVENEIDARLADMRDKTQDAVNTIGAQIDSVLADFKGKTQTAVNSFGTEIQTRVNQGLTNVIPVLYAMMGFGPGQLVTIVNTQKVTTTGFEYYALAEGQKTHYVALGVP